MVIPVYPSKSVCGYTVIITEMSVPRMVYIPVTRRREAIAA
jgi:hypothetical protein